jgi:3-mercaptopyruvate sulfurtransferase SseA
MRLKLICSAIILAVMVVLTACNAVDTTLNTNTNTNANPAPAGPQTTYADGARRITTSELETLMKEGKAYVVDVRLQDAYDMGHIPGARLIPSGSIEQHIKELPRDKMIVTYCS